MTMRRRYAPLALLLVLAVCLTACQVKFVPYGKTENNGGNTTVTDVPPPNGGDTDPVDGLDPVGGDALRIDREALAELMRDGAVAKGGR